MVNIASNHRQTANSPKHPLPHLTYPDSKTTLKGLRGGGCRGVLKAIIARQIT